MTTNYHFMLYTRKVVLNPNRPVASSAAAAAISGACFGKMVVVCTEILRKSLAKSVCGSQSIEETLLAMRTEGRSISGVRAISQKI